MTRSAHIATLAALSLGAAFVATCDSESPHEAATSAGGGGSGGASSSATTSVVSTTSSATGSGGAPACNPPKPAVIPDGWVAWTDWSCDCPFWIPGDDSLMPPPLQWEPRVAQPVPGIECQQIVVDWAGGAFQPFGAWPQFSLDAGGAAPFHGGPHG